jgi:uncharacterized Ntn-hydrolase superfamily protein
VTYSIVGRDRVSGQIGGAVQSAAFSSGAGTLWVDAGIGAIATQAFTERSFGPLGLEMLTVGWTPRQVIAAVLAGDAHPAVRQLGVIDLEAPAASMTGEDCVPEAGHCVAEDCAAQANMMANRGVPQAMVTAFERCDGDVGARLLSALDAAQETGGDFRGMQSAGLTVREGERGVASWKSAVFNLRVDDSDKPLVELRRLVGLTRTYRRFNQPLELLAEGDTEAALTVAEEIVSTLPDKTEPKLRLAIALQRSGRTADARSLLRAITAQDQRWLTYVDNLLALWPTGVTTTDLRQLLTNS